MMDFKVVTVVGTRPELIRLSRVLAALDRYVNHVLVHTGQNYDYELNQIFFDDLGLRKPDHFLNSAGKNASVTIANILASVDEIYDQEKPDAVLVLGDTNSCLSVIPAKRRKIPVFHMEAGNRSFDMRVPEEINRRIVDHTADINLTYSDISREYLLREGLPPDLVIKTGSPMYEVLNHYRSGIEASDALVRNGLEDGRYFLVSAHREENIESDERFGALLKILNGLAEEQQLPVLVSAHPRFRNRFERFGQALHPAVQLKKPFGFFEYVKLQTRARVVLSDSGTISEESSILGFPALNIRESHERPEAMEEGSVILTGLSLARIRSALPILDVQREAAARGQPILQTPRDYSMGNVSEKVVRLILSYTDYVKRVVWREYQTREGAE